MPWTRRRLLVLLIGALALSAFALGLWTGASDGRKPPPPPAPKVGSAAAGRP